MIFLICRLVGRQSLDHLRERQAARVEYRPAAASAAAAAGADCRLRLAFLGRIERGRVDQHQRRLHRQLHAHALKELHDLVVEQDSSSATRLLPHIFLSPGDLVEYAPATLTTSVVIRQTPPEHLLLHTCPSWNVS